VTKIFKRAPAASTPYVSLELRFQLLIQLALKMPKESVMVKLILCLLLIASLFVDWLSFSNVLLSPVSVGGASCCRSRP
jgi:hypothetical protein